jgi:hypothetical protein
MDQSSPTASTVVITMDRQGRRKRALQAGVSELNIVSFSMNFFKSELLQFMSIGITANSKTHSAHMLVDSRVSHHFVNKKFVQILGLVYKISGSMIMRMTNNHSDKMPYRQVYLTFSDERNNRRQGTSR